MFFRFSHFFGILLIVFTFSIASAQYLPQQKDIDTAFLKNVVEKLCHKDYAGRLPGSNGYNMAATAVGHYFKEFNIKPIMGSSYFQYFNVEYNQIKSPLKFEKINTDGTLTAYTPGKDFVCRGFTGKGTHTAEVVFCGYGIDLPNKKYNDYKGIDVKGKVVMIFKENPPWKIKKTEWPSAAPRYKAQIASKHGAVGVILVSAPKNSRNTKPIGSIATDNIKGHHHGTTSIHVSNEVADEILKTNNIDIVQLQHKIDSTQKPHSFNTGVKVNTEIHTDYTEEMPTMNVIGRITGSDSVLRNEYLIIGAHLDHVGSQGDSLFFPGANDNASGVAAVLHIAKLFSENRAQLKRSVIFILFANEEQGLYGSQHYVNNPLVPLSKTVAMINLDCIAHGDSIRIGNGKSAPLLWDICKSIDSNNSNLMVESTWGGGGADATPFHQKNIPALYFVTTNSYTHLHLPTDTPETLNVDLFQKIVHLAASTAWHIATGNYQKEKLNN